MLNRMFPESFREAVHSLVNLLQLFYLHDIIKEAMLDIFLRDKSGKDNAGLPVKFTRVVNRVEAFAQRAEKICGVCGRRTEFYFNTAVFKVLPPEKYNDTRCRQLIAPCLYARVLKVL